MHCSSLEMHSCILMLVKACWCFSVYHQEALSWQYCYSQLLLQGIACLLSVWKERLSFLVCLCPCCLFSLLSHSSTLWSSLSGHSKCSSEVPRSMTELRHKLWATKVHVYMSSLEPACPGELLGRFLPWFWPKSTGALPVSANSLGALWGWGRFP